MRWMLVPIWSSSALVMGCATLSQHAGNQQASDASTPLRAASSACSAVPGATLWVRTELYFGMQKPDNSFTSNDEYQRFVDEKVTPRFRDGFTVLEGRGQYLGADGRLWREPTKILVLMYPPDASKSRAIDEIRSAYKAEFHQEAVMRIDGTTCAQL